MSDGSDNFYLESVGVLGLDPFSDDSEWADIEQSPLESDAALFSNPHFLSERMSRTAQEELWKRSNEVRSQRRALLASAYPEYDWSGQRGPKLVNIAKAPLPNGVKESTPDENLQRKSIPPPIITAE